MRVGGAQPVQSCRAQRDAKSPPTRVPPSGQRAAGLHATCVDFMPGITRARLVAMCRGASLEVHAASAVHSWLCTRGNCSIEIEPPSWRQQQPAWSTQRSSIHVTPLEVALKPAPCADNLADEAYIYSSRLQRDARRVCAASTLLPPATPDPCCGCPPAGGGSIMLVNRRCSVDVDCVYQPWLWAVGKLTISRFEACHAWQRNARMHKRGFVENDLYYVS